MKKKIISLIPATGCNEGSASLNMISYNTKYIHKNDLDNEEDLQRYFIFYANGTGKYNYYENSSFYDTIYHYTVTFKYTYADASCETVACFYDSVYYYDDNTGSKISSNWSRTLGVSKNVVIDLNENGYLYVNENYAKNNLKNFGK